MQNAGIATLQLNWRYLAFDVHPDHLRPAIEGARRMGFVGLNLTVPHKLLALEMVDVVDDQAKPWGAVNTIVFETRDGNGQWVPVGGVRPGQIGEVRSRGFNTDADAIVQSLQDEFLVAKVCAAPRCSCSAQAARRADCGNPPGPRRGWQAVPGQPHGGAGGGIGRRNSERLRKRRSD